MRRREFISLIGGAAAAWPLAARAQALPVIGFMSARSPEDTVQVLAAFHKGLGDGGFVNGRNVSVEYRWARGDYGRLPALAAELVQQRVIVLVATGGDASARAAKEATATIPVVFNAGSDPIKAGLVQSFNRRHRIDHFKRRNGAKAVRYSAGDGTGRHYLRCHGQSELSSLSRSGARP